MVIRTLSITNVGPIVNTATIEFKRYCILIGPQSRGKSTIAKILSTCLWIEKEACTSFNEHVVSDGKHFKALVEDFHRMHNYIHPDSSVIEYSSPYIKLKYSKGEFLMSFVGNLDYQCSKISYIPSDRNVALMKDIEKRELEQTNFRSFLFDWLEAKRKFDVQHKLPILNLDMRYYFNAETDEGKDMLTHENGVSYDIPLYDASSGMQSLVPMNVLMHYLATGYFDNYGSGVSFEKRQKQTKLARNVAEKITAKHFPRQVEELGFENVYENEIRKNASGMADVCTDEMNSLYQQLATPHNISFIVEEPEQNLFPATQVDLFNDIVAVCNAKNGSSAFITTHSPYLLASANILLFAGKLKNKGVDQQSVDSCVRSEHTIPATDFTAYCVDYGGCESIVDEKTGLIKENELDSASVYNSEIFDKLYQLYAQTIRKQ